jgi:hypothetical protein
MPGNEKSALRKQAEGLGETGAWIIAAAVADDAQKLPITVLNLYRTLYKDISTFDDRAPPNPLLLDMGITTNLKSPYTSKYITGRMNKKLGGSILGFFSGLLSGVTQVDAVGGGVHASAAASSGSHYLVLKSIAEKHNNPILTDWCDACAQVKLVKGGIRGGQAVAALIPVGAVGIGANIAASLGKSGVALTYGTIMNKFAMQIHVTAYWEAENGEADGVATQIIREIFRRAGLRSVLQPYNVSKIASEAGGWVALKDKLLLM